VFKWIFTLALTLTVGFLALLLIYGLPQGRLASAETPAVRSTEVPMDSKIAETVAAYQTREAQMQAQLSRLTALIAGLVQAEDQAAEIAEQVATVQAARNERLGVYQAQLQQAQAEYDTRYAAMVQQLVDAEAKLGEANAILGR
jgi:hypothetical protein